jgi:hypothetical protein
MNARIEFISVLQFFDSQNRPARLINEPGFDHFGFLDHAGL